MKITKADVKNLIVDYDILAQRLSDEDLTYAEDIIVKHENGECNCDLPKSDDYDTIKYDGYCLAGCFVEGQIDINEFIYCVTH